MDKKNKVTIYPFWERGYKYAKIRLSQIQSFLNDAEAQHIAINESGTALHGGDSRIWIVCVMPNNELTAFYDEKNPENGEFSLREQ